MPAAPIAAKRFKDAAILICKIALAFGLLAWLVKSGRLDFSKIAHAHWGAALCGLVLSQAAMLGCIALRWHFLTRACGLDFSWRQTLRIGLIGNFAAVWTPAGLGLDGARVVLARRLAPTQNARIAASAILDRVLSVWALTCLCVPACAIFLLPKNSLQGLSENLRRALTVILVACVLASLAPLLLRGRALQALARRVPKLQKIFASLGDAPGVSLAPNFSWTSDLARATALAFATHACNFLGLWCALKTLGVEAALWQVLPAAPLIVLSSLLPLTPLGLGVTDATASTLLHALGTSGGGEAAMLGRPTFILLSAACGLAWLKRNEGS